MLCQLHACTHHAMQLKTNIIAAACAMQDAPQQSSRRRGPARETIFDRFDATPPRDLPAAAQDTYKAWCASMAAACQQADGGGMIQPHFVANFVAWLHGHLGARDDGAILVFLAGLSDIGDVHKALEKMAPRGALLIPLHSALGPASQRGVFRRPPAGVRKIVLATNIAETSITIDDVTVVVDAGVHKVMEYDALNRIRQLSMQWCALLVVNKTRRRVAHMP